MAVSASETSSTTSGPNLWLLGGIGIGAGVLSGLFGVGGGLVMVPAMVLLAHFTQQRAAATSLGAIVPIAIVGAIIFGRADSVNLVAAVVLAVGSIVGVQVGARVMPRLGDDRLRIGFAIFMIGVAITMLFA